MAEHYHPVLQVFVDGRPVLVPSNIGVDTTTGGMSGLHTHSSDGVLHIEAAEVGEIFTLGQFFTEWGVSLTAQQVGGAHARSGDTVSVTVNGVPYGGDPAGLRLAPDQQIVVRVG